MSMPDPTRLACPVPLAAADRIELAHGEGGQLMRRLIERELLPAFDNDHLRPLADAALLPQVDGCVVMTTDSSVVSPLFFPGGDIGRLAVHGAVNDLAVCGAEPLYVSLAFILEEGLALQTLRRVIASVRSAAQACGVQIVTGDTKVVPRGAADGLFITTTAIGRLRPGTMLGAARVRSGDRVLVSGSIGDHGLAILTAREGMDMGEGLVSDTAPVHEMVRDLLTSCGADVHFLRDPTRGGVAAVLHELIAQTRLSVILDESALPISPTVRGASELLGLDPLYIANEGKIVAVVAAEVAERACLCLRQHPRGHGARIIGEVQGTTSTPQLHLAGLFGTRRIVDEPSGAPLPRIC